MNYRKDKNGNDLSLLGFGCMRFQKKFGKINMELCEKQIMNAYKNGVNYFDTAFIYPGSESAIGEVFEKNNIRENIYIATKLPPQLMVNIDVLEKLFKESAIHSISTWLRTNECSEKSNVLSFSLLKS